MEKEQKSAEQSGIDILEEDISELSPELLDILLSDMTTGRNIVFACSDYRKYGARYAEDCEILPELITGANTRVIRPRTVKSKDERQNRTRSAAEVFTPAWVCNEMINNCDELWFGRKDVFNIQTGKSWRANPQKAEFPAGKSWKDYVDSRRLEITCGEAPYLVSRYDASTGRPLPLEERIGILDRKLRVVAENAADEKEWRKWARRAVESTYGYEYQGDNLLLARENLLCAYADCYAAEYGAEPDTKLLKEIASVIAWNIWQMDGLNDSAPFCVSESQERQLELFEALPKVYEPVPCKIKDWRSGKIIYFKDLKGTKDEI